MKKYLFLCLSALCMISCCNKVEIQDTNRIVLDLQINSSEWKYSGLDNNNYFVGNFDLPELTKGIYDNGTILVYRELDWDTRNPIQQILPYSRHHEYLANSSEQLWGFFTETVDFEYGIGFLNIFYTASDFDYEVDQTFVPETMHFRLVITW